MFISVKKLFSSLVIVSILQPTSMLADGNDALKSHSKISQFFVGILQPMPSLIGVNVYQQVDTNIRVGLGVGTSHIGEVSILAYSIGAHWVFSPSRRVSPVIGIAYSNGEKNEVRKDFFVSQTGIEVTLLSDLTIGLGLNWSLNQINGRHLVLPYFSIGTIY